MRRGNANRSTKGRDARPFFYGWTLVGGLGVVSAMFIMLGGPNFGLFVKPIAEDLGIGQASFGWSHTARLLAAGVSAPLIGRLLDRHGSRWPLVVVGLLIGFIVVGLSFVNTAWQLVGLFTALGFIGVMGAGSSLYTTVPIAKWFVRNRGRAMALMSIGVPVSIAISVPMTQWTIDQVGWRVTWMILGGVAGGVTILMALLVVRRQPEDMGLMPDGDPPEDGSAVDRPPGQAERVGGEARGRYEYPWTRSEAVGTGTFWRLTLVFSLQMFAAATGVFRIPFFVDQGINPQMVAYSMSLNAGMGAAMAVPLGFLMDRVQLRYPAIIGLICSACGFLSAMATHSEWQMFLSGALFGMGAGTMMILQSTMWPVYFGRAHVGSIRGLGSPVILGISAIGAPLTGMMKDGMGSYFPAWWVAVVGLTIGMVVMLFTPRPRSPAMVAAAR